MKFQHCIIVSEIRNSKIQNSILSIHHLIQNASGQIDILDAEILLAHVLKKDRAFIVAHPEAKIGRLEDWRFVRLMKKRKAGFPLAYLTQQKEFYGLDFFVNKHTLIPRPETELLVSLALDRLRILDCRLQNTMLIDVGTGSGCIPISIVKTQSTHNQQSEIQNLKFYAIDISRSALRVAKKNAKKHGADITFLHGDLLKPIIQKSEIYNPKSEIFLTANLPYLTKEQYTHSPTPEIRREPLSALVAGDNGLALYKKLINQIKQLQILDFRFQIICFFEIDPSQALPLAQYIRHIFPTATIEIKKDLAGRDRVVVLSLDERVSP